MVLETFNYLSGISLFGVLIMMISFASALDLQQFWENIKKPKGIAIGLICQYILLPFMAFSVAIIFKNDLLIEQRIALLLIGTCPGGTLSNFFCFLFGADLTLSIAMTTASSLSSFIFLTINTIIYIPILAKGTDIKIDYVSLFLSVATLVIGVSIGLFLSFKSKKEPEIDNNKNTMSFKQKWFNCDSWKLYKYTLIKIIIGWLASIVLFGGFIASMYSNFSSEYPIWNLSAIAWLAPLILAFFAWIIAFIAATMCKMPKNSRVAVAIECANQVFIYYLIL